MEIEHGVVSDLWRAVLILVERDELIMKATEYVLVEGIQDALKRIKFLKGIAVDPFAQAYRDSDNNEPVYEQEKLCRWVNHKAIFKSVNYFDYARQDAELQADNCI